MQAQAAEHGVDQLLGAELQEHEIAFAQTGGFVDPAAQVLGHRLHRALRPRAPFADAGAGQPARSEALGELLELVEVGSRQRLRVRGRQPPSLDDTARAS
jgi:hypothetical protein